MPALVMAVRSRARRGGGLVGKLVMVGLSHHAAPLEIRERVAIDEVSWRAVAPSRARVDPAVHVQSRRGLRLGRGALDASHPCAAAIAWRAPPGMDLRDLSRTCARAPAATRCSTWSASSSGLDSLVVGEEQIRGQVRDALRAAETHAAVCRRSLRGHFQRVGESARRVRGGTDLGAAPSIASAGVNVAVRR